MKKLIGYCFAVLLMSGCAGQKQAPQSLKIGVMPSLDSAPLIWAEKNGYFEEVGLDLELVVYFDANDRNTQVQTGAVDAVVMDIMGLVALRDSGLDVVGLSATDTLFSMVGKQENIGKDPLVVGMAEVSVTQFAADKAIAAVMDKQFIDAVPQRLEMAAQGLIDGAILPEPMASMAVANGLARVELALESPNILMWQQAKVGSSEVTKFYQAYDKAVETMMDDPSALKDAMIEKLNLDPKVKDAMVFPSFTKARDIEEETFEAVLAWMRDTLNMDSSQSFSEATSNQR